MKQNLVFTGLALFFAAGCTAFGADASEHLRPEALEASIRQHRIGDLVVKAKPGATVRIEQLRHEFWFGAALSSGIFGGRSSEEDRQRYKETFLANFNTAATENALKRRKLDSPVVDIPPGLDAHAGGRGVSRPCLQAMVDPLGRQGGCGRPMPCSRLLRQIRRNVRGGEERSVIKQRQWTGNPALQVTPAGRSDNREK